MKSLFVSACITLLHPAVATAETLYGSFRFDERAPNSLFLTGEIQSGDSFELRKALREHDIKIVVMGSAGGNLYEGLQMGAILRDKEVSTFVPRGLNCESSCANMFFGGAKRKADGKLGVHQFYSRDGERSVALGETEASTQYTMADVIGIMNELGTPPFVYEKMLGTPDIYYFSEDELRLLDLDPAAPDFRMLQDSTNTLIADYPEVIARFGSEAQPLASVEPRPQNPTPSSGTQAPQPVEGSDIYKETDFFGSDLTLKGIRGVSQLECEKICRSDMDCAAWSYVHETHWCWPKSEVSNISLAIGITSGVKDYSRVDPSVINRPFFEATAVDLPGNDLLSRGLSNTSLEDCRQACLSSSACTAFTWIGKKNICFPKYAAGPPAKFVGAISGVKR